MTGKLKHMEESIMMLATYSEMHYTLKTVTNG